MNPIACGYRQAQDGRGRIVDPESAAVVRAIFEDYAAGLCPNRIAEALTAQGVPAPALDAGSERR